MSRTVATHFLILVLSLGTVLSLPGGLLAAVGASASGCPHCHMSGHNSGPCPCCPHRGKAGHCDNSGPNAGFNCRCSAGGPAALAPIVTGAPTRQIVSHDLAMVVFSAKLLSPNIFHPPELNSQVWS